MLAVFLLVAAGRTDRGTSRFARCKVDYMDNHIEVVEEWRRAKSFLEWTPGPATNKRQTVSLGSGRSFVYKGGTYTNLVVDERHYAPADLAKAWGVDVETIRNLFREEPGVVKIGDKNPRHRRPYLTLRIPESVAVRVHKRLSE
jgi:hypothetical protein